VFLGRSVTQTKNVSDDTAHEIDREIKQIVERNYERAKNILVEKNDILHAMADALIKYETIDATQLAKLMRREPPGPPENWTDGNGGPGKPSATDSASPAAPATVQPTPAA
jgi:cell division protease FtsH